VSQVWCRHLEGTCLVESCACAGIDPAPGDDQSSDPADEGEKLLSPAEGFPHLRKRFWGRHVGARGYFCRSSGNMTDEVIKAYIESQSHNNDEVFRLEGEEFPPGEPPSA
jgi:hypothetical protein